ncbi:MAG: DNA mismatch repair protein MutS [Chloroflexi bacterium]|nr:DNA mismatch repair protein MutS [Chloroflexota bacterium]
MAMTTPIRRQYLRVKKQFPNAIVLFRLGDFYETFDEDARIMARELEITLTSREMGKGTRIPMAGVPYHALDTYLARLIRKGYKVALCEQVSDPAASKGLVQREVVRVVTPGTVVEPTLLEQKANNYLAAVVVAGDEAGLAYADITTSEFATAQLSLVHLPMELERLAPAELLISEDAEPPPGAEGIAAVTRLPPSAFDSEMARETLLEHFGVATLEGYGCAGLPLAVRAAGAILHYLRETQRAALGQLASLRTSSLQHYMTLDPQTRRNLEIFQGSRPSSSGASLLHVLDRTRTPMGGRLLRRWLGQPLLDLAELQQRLDTVEWFFRSSIRRERTVAALARVGDLERLVNRTKSCVATAREVVALGHSLAVVPEIVAVLAEDPAAAGWLRERLHPCAEVVGLITRALEEESATPVGEGGVIKEGFSQELDELRLAARNARAYIAGLERKERERSGIGSLKVGYNKVFGYYIEVTKPNLSRVPADYLRRQTLVNAERFITPDLKEYESLVLNAQERMAELEGALFRQVCRQVGEEAPRILATADALAQVDVFCALGEVASRYGYVRPVLTEGDRIEIKAGRHPVVERALPPGTFVPNDTVLSPEEGQLVVLTGPNMSGKSTYIRQVALIVLIAQMGSFVPADAASIGLVDRVFTRVGLHDDLTTGKSTFMVEMVETAQILNHATPRSLIILDEIGRGTSTYDGLAIARAVAEYIHNHPRLGCKTLFATHYHELTGLARTLPRVRNYNVAVTEEGSRVIFLHRIVPGGADRSYGVHVAQLAGLPRPVIHRAWEVLRELEVQAKGDGALRRTATAKSAAAQQLALFPPVFPPVLEEVAKLDINSLTPLEALNKLYELQKKAQELADSSTPGG